jgi:alpha-methylacyl-CoA racemase
VSPLLAGLRVVDFSSRLPGPMACSYLGELGATVVKIEDIHHVDPFECGIKNVETSEFPVWYKNINGEKNIIRYDFKNESDQEKIKQLIAGSHVFISSLPEKVEKLIDLDQTTLNALNLPIAKVNVHANIDRTPMHDLNALAQSGALKLYLEDKDSEIVRPPFLPLAGMVFSKQLALEATSCWIKALSEKSFVQTHCYLLDSFVSASKKLQLEGEFSYLHYGAYPSYNIYRLKDHSYLAVAAVEEHFFKSFIEIFDLDIKLEDRFSKSVEVLKKISSTLQTFSSQNAMDLLKNVDICVDVITQ